MADAALYCLAALALTVAIVGVAAWACHVGQWFVPGGKR